MKPVQVTAVQFMIGGVDEHFRMFNIPVPRPWVSWIKSGNYPNPADFKTNCLAHGADWKQFKKAIVKAKDIQDRLSICASILRGDTVPVHLTGAYLYIQTA